MPILLLFCLSKINNNNNYQSRYASCSFKESRAPCTDLFYSVFWGAFVWDAEMSHKVSSINNINYANRKTKLCLNLVDELRKR